VCWLTERRDVLSGALYLLALRVLVPLRAGGPRAARLRAEPRAARALAGREGLGHHVLRPAARARPAGVPQARLLADPAVEKLPFLGLALVAGALALWAQSGAAGALRTLEQHGLVARLEQAGYGALFYPHARSGRSICRPIYSLPEPFDARRAAVRAGPWRRPA
jgi:hypothetical protein